MNKKVAAIVVTYNRKELLSENIRCLLAQTKRNEMDIIIIDNASTDGTDKYISHFIDSDDIIYINTGHNSGSAGGFQLAFRYAAQNDYEFAWVMDDDCMPTETALEEFLKYDKKLNGNYGFLSSKVLWTDGSICKMTVQRETMMKNLTDFSKDIIKCEMASVVSLLVPVSVIKKVGLPIKEFFIWTDDWEYTRRISREYPCYVVTSSVTIHKSKLNIGANIAIDMDERLYRYKYIYRNDVVLYRREGVKGYIYIILRDIYHIIRVLIKSRDKKFQRIKYIVDGTIEGLCFHPQIEYLS